jgi:hypothetical protein
LNTSGILIVDPNNPLRRKKLDSVQRTELMVPVVKSGSFIALPIEQIREHRKQDLARSMRATNVSTIPTNTRWG